MIAPQIDRWMDEGLQSPCKRCVLTFRSLRRVGSVLGLRSSTVQFLSLSFGSYDLDASA